MHPFNHQLEDDSTAPHRWSAVSRETGLPSPAEINHGLLTMIAALKPEFTNPTAAAALEGFFTRSGSVSMPSEGEFPLALRADIAHAFRALWLDRVAFAPEFHPFDPMEELRLEDVWATDEAPPFRGTLTDFEETLLFTVDWDSFFIEGFFVDASTTHTWWRPSTPAAFLADTQPSIPASAYQESHRDPDFAFSAQRTVCAQQLSSSSPSFPCPVPS